MCPIRSPYCSEFVVDWRDDTEKIILDLVNKEQ